MAFSSLRKTSLDYRNLHFKQAEEEFAIVTFFKKSNVLKKKRGQGPIARTCLN